MGFDRSVAFQRILYEGKRSILVPRPGDVAFEKLAFLISQTLEVVHLSAELHIHDHHQPDDLRRCVTAAERTDRFLRSWHVLQ